MAQIPSAHSSKPTESSEDTSAAPPEEEGLSFHQAATPSKTKVTTSPSKVATTQTASETPTTSTDNSSPTAEPDTVASSSEETKPPPPQAPVTPVVTVESGSVKKGVRENGFLAGITLLLLLPFQVYWYIGSNLHNEANALLQKQEQLNLNIMNAASEFKRQQLSQADGKSSSTAEEPLHLSRWRHEFRELNQKLEEHKHMLHQWNQWWAVVFGSSTSGAMPTAPNQQKMDLQLQSYFVEATVLARRLTSDNHQALSSLQNALTTHVQTLTQKMARSLSQGTGASHDESSPLVLQDVQNQILGALNQLLVISTPKAGIGANTTDWKALKTLETKAKNSFLKNTEEINHGEILSVVLSSKFVLSTLEFYILPLLYGLMGAITFILRILAREMKSGTRSHDSLSQHRVRLCLGTLGGLFMGWFLKPDELASLGSVSSLTLAFLVGYHIEILFAVLDKLIDTINASLSTLGSKQTTPPKTSVNHR